MIDESLRVRDLSKRYGARSVLRHVSFEIEPGRVVAVVGRNGAGKSTLLRVVAGLIPPTSGRVAWRDETGESDNVALLCGLSAPDAPVYRELSCLENLEFFARVRGLKRDEAALRLHLQRFALGERAGDFAGELSSGLRARLGLAVAMLHAPKILLLDEPGANLDDAGRVLLQDVLREQRTRGLALVATNDAREAGACDGRIELGF